jgi:hypothetical protein
MTHHLAGPLDLSATTTLEMVSRPQPGGLGKSY